jgi:hypothetical protein
MNCPICGESITKYDDVDRDPEFDYALTHDECTRKDGREQLKAVLEEMKQRHQPKERTVT